jgi:ferritin-like metal-binding protein YciE
MGIFRKELNSMTELLIDQLADLYDAEQRLLDALEDMAEAATSTELKSAFREHLAETKEHVRRLEQAFQLLDESPNRETCDAMKGLISEGNDVVKARGDSHVRDAALIAAAQRVEHYEIAGYGCCRNFAMRIGAHDVADLLQQTLDEEGAADRKLTSIAESSVNVKAG